MSFPSEMSRDSVYPSYLEDQPSADDHSGKFYNATKTYFPYKNNVAKS